MTTKKPATVAATNGVAQWDRYGAIVPPMQLSSTYAFEGYDKTSGYDYSRSANPNRDLLAETLAKLEEGAGAVVTASGMAAVDLALSQLGRGDTVVAPHDCYGGTYRLLAERARRGDFRVTFVDQGDAAALEAALKGAALLFLETPSNPLMRVTDIRRACDLAHAAGAKVIVDNTFLSPALQRPLTLGADFVVHSTTKFINGHSDVVGGAVIAAREDDLAPLVAWANTTGTIGAPFDAYMTLRGLRTLFVRIAQQERNAAAVAGFLRAQPQVKAVHYPGLPEDPAHALAASQQSGFGAMLSFELEGGIPAVQAFVAAIRIFTLAESLGGVESLVAHPATMTHAAMGAEARAAAGIGDGLLRLSVGLEDADDLLGDLRRAFAAIA
ncbi:cystathionine gamma-synthase [Sinirhodobacter populi]|uniref:Cystathionine gamma-synthase n=1 Tax=Paenirhodobacter populi TaxID=2306993 RepID=A0A443KB17_9RHOB|nr:cystathionine gamma-synthase [Sinirhodobacter populi]RWR30009.1 cystathionine gamma-synthase [Sinirhodobacter populi]